MSQEQSASFNIAVLPDQRVTDLAIGLSQNVTDSYPTEFVLDQEQYRPHVTIYQAHFPVANVGKVEEILAQIASNIEPFKITLEEFVISLDTFLWWNSQSSPGIRKLHSKIVNRTNPLREGLILPHLATVTGMTQEDKDDMQKFGALKIGPRFSPHVTITRLSRKEDATNAVKKLGLYSRVIFEVNELILGYLGPNGTVNGVIKTFKLGSS